MKFWDMYTKAIIAEGVAVLLIILTVATLKFCFKKTYKKVSNFYIESVLSDTDINEVLKGEV